MQLTDQQQRDAIQAVLDGVRSSWSYRWRKRLQRRDPFTEEQANEVVRHYSGPVRRRVARGLAPGEFKAAAADLMAKTPEVEGVRFGSILLTILASALLRIAIEKLIEWWSENA